MEKLLNSVSSSSNFSHLTDHFSKSDKPFLVGGSTGSLSSLLAADLQRKLNVPVVFVCPSPALVESRLDDLNALTGGEVVASLPPAHLHPYDTAPLAPGPHNERIDALLRLSNRESLVLVTQPEALLERCPDQAWIKRHSIRLQRGEDSPREIIILELTTAGYKRERVVDSQGQFAIRGGIVDIFPYGQEQPVRIEYDEDTILSLRRFDPVTQRSTGQIPQITMLVGAEESTGQSAILDLIPAGSILIWDGREEIDQRIQAFHERAQKAFKSGLARDGINPDELYLNQEEIEEHARPLKQLVIKQLGHGRQIDFDLDSRHPDSYTPDLGGVHDYVQRYVNDQYEIWITTDTSGEKDRLREMLFDYHLEQVKIVTPTLSSGFACHHRKLVVLTAHELFQRRRRRVRHTRFRRRAVQFDRTSLQKGDLVVHAEYGIGRYEGLQMVKVKGQPHECLRIRYADDVILYIRIEQFNLIEKYTGMDNAAPKLTRIGTKDWDRAKKKTRKAIQDIADELVKLYAQRKVIPGYSFPADTQWQAEMEDSFEFDDTPDQVVTTREIKEDLMSSQPMDRLLCGDVGFGKTEVAIRAAFKVVQDSCQVAVLVPTTILAQQHYETFKERLASFPIKIDVLSRFRTQKEQKETVAALKAGKVDIVIGTHRLVSKDVAFKNLGLVIIDEEHRFGVKHKERLKQVKTNVDVLTMTATPIPRTLHLALSGARDTSQINSPPVDRLPIQTEVYGWSEDLIRDAILREIDRRGQVFFLHNRVASIYAVKGMLDRIVPGIRIGVAHGQMPERQLEKVMIEFMRGAHDVLVSTMIIESGLDIPNANTLIVNRADRLGLAQLYQLRGRIGRSNRQAYAYLLTPPRLVVTNDARRRLETLVELTDLGSGMKVAMRDLEIRGAGNLLGSQQSGFINTVGFDLYTHMLEEAVHQAKGEELPTPQESSTVLDVKIEYSGPALIPADYIDDSDLRYFFYKKLSNAQDLEWVGGLEDELIDRFGSLPLPARNLITLSRLKVMCGIVGFNRLAITPKMMIAAMNLPADPTQSQKILGRLVAQAAPEQIEFKMKTPIELIFRFKYGKSLEETLTFLRHMSRMGILRD